MAVDTAPADVLGAPIKRVEDPKFITGNGRYLDDIHLQGMTHLAILRSPYAHANIRSIDPSAAKGMPGVLAVFTGADIPYNPLPMAWPAGGASGIQNNVSTPRILATDSVKWTGEGVAAVVAETEAQAVDARHRGHGIAFFLAFLHEHRIDQVVGRQRMLPHQVAGEGIATQAPRPAGGEHGKGRK